MNVLSIEERDKEVIYWLDKVEGFDKKIGIIMEGGQNCVRDEIVSGIILGEYLLKEIINGK
jgi:hypothetical protein